MLPPEFSGLSHCKNSHFTMFGKLKSMMLLKRLFTKFFLWYPNCPVLTLNYWIICSISDFMWSPPSSRHSSSRSYILWRPWANWSVVSICYKKLSRFSSSSVLIFLTSLAFSFSKIWFRSSRLVIYYFFLFLDSLALCLLSSSLLFLDSSLTLIEGCLPLFLRPCFSCYLNVVSSWSD